MNNFSTFIFIIKRFSCCYRCQDFFKTTFDLTPVDFWYVKNLSWYQLEKKMVNVIMKDKTHFVSEIYLHMPSLKIDV